MVDLWAGLTLYNHIFLYHRSIQCRVQIFSASMQLSYLRKPYLQERAAPEIIILPVSLFLHLFSALSQWVLLSALFLTVGSTSLRML